MIPRTDAELRAYNENLAKLKARGTVRTHRMGDQEEVSGQDRLQTRQAGLKQPRYGTNATPAVPEVVPKFKNAAAAPKQAQTHVFPGLPPAICEFRFAAPRKWRFDYAWTDFKVALEVEGGVWTEGRHTRGKGFLADMEKYNEAAIRSWKVIRATPEQVKSGAILQTLKRLVF